MSFGETNVESLNMSVAHLMNILSLAGGTILGGMKSSKGDN